MADSERSPLPERQVVRNFNIGDGFRSHRRLVCLVRPAASTPPRVVTSDERDDGLRCPMKKILEKHDAFGQEMWAYLKGELPYEIVERDDGYIDASQFTSLYFAEFRTWPKRQRQSMRSDRGRRW